MQDVSLDIQAGSFMTLLGPSGSGKTTTLKMIAGFDPPDTGEIVIGGESVTKLPPHRRNIGVVFQNYALFPHMTVFENVAFPLKMRGWTDSKIKAEVAQSLQMVELADFGHRYPSQLSGGQQQRVALARAIVFRPPLLLMDEPLGALDKQLRKHVQIEIKRIQEQLGITIVYVTHDQEEALFMSDRIAVMNEGRIEQVSTPYTLYNEPDNRFVAEFLGESNVLSGVVVGGDETAVRVRVGPHEIVGRAAQPLPGERRVDVIIRPEKFRLGTVEADNRITVQVQHTYFMGDAVRVEARADDGVELAVKVPLQQVDRVPTPGETCVLGWSLDDTRILLPQESEASHG